jgi:hypothetical protein
MKLMGASEPNVTRPAAADIKHRGRRWSFVAPIHDCHELQIAGWLPFIKFFWITVVFNHSTIPGASLLAKR